LAATKDDLRHWFQKGRFSSERPYRYMVIRCDTFDWTDYPSYYETAADAKAITSNPGDMQRVMEVYDLHADMETQLAEHRAWHL
jgi:hypothetical protein